MTKTQAKKVAAHLVKTNQAFCVAYGGIVDRDFLSDVYGIKFPKVTK